MRSAAALVLILAWLAPGEARACSGRHTGMFERAERARYVALTRALPRGLRVEESLVGRARSFRIRPDAACPPIPRPGHRGLVLAEARVLDSDTEYVEDPSAAQVAAVRRFVATPDADARRRVLVDLATGTDPVVARDAVHLLGMRPALLRDVTEVERRRLIATVEGADAHVHLPALALVLARLHDLAAVEPLLARFDDADRMTAALGTALQLLTMHRQPEERFDDVFDERLRWTSIRRHYSPLLSDLASGPTLAQVVRRHWRPWLEAHRGADRAALWTNAFHERGLRVPDRDDPEALARTMVRAPDGVLRAAALDRCEQLVGRPLAPYRWDPGGVSNEHWDERAAACRAAARSGQ